MESNYIKSARVKLSKLGIKTYEDYQKNKLEIFDIIWKTFELEYSNRWDYHLLSSYPLLKYAKLSEANLWLEHQPQPWEMQTLEYYTERKTYERTKQTLPLL